MATIDYRFESFRLQSFNNWTVAHVSPEALAAAGFYYVGPDDKVRCFCCSIEIGRWAVNDDPLVEHISWSSRCRFALNLPCGNVPIGADLDTILPYPPIQDICGTGVHDPIGLPSGIQNLSLDELTSMGVGSMKNPAYPDFINYDTRLSSFDCWPKSIPQSKEQLARAGFFYTGKSDQTLCHHCGAGLKDWVLEDDPWVEHAKWKPECFYLWTVKGREFINSVQTGLTNNSPQVCFIGSNFVKKFNFYSNSYFIFFFTIVLLFFLRLQRRCLRYRSRLVTSHHLLRRTQVNHLMVFCAKFVTLRNWALFFYLAVIWLRV